MFSGRLELSCFATTITAKISAAEGCFRGGCCKLGLQETHLRCEVSYRGRGGSPLRARRPQAKGDGVGSGAFELRAEGETPKP